MIEETNAPLPNSLALLPYEPEHEAFRETLRCFLADEVAPHIDQWEEQGACPTRHILRKLGDAGLLGMSSPESVGGFGPDFRFNVVWGEELGQLDAGGIAMSLASHTDCSAPLIAHFGSEDQYERFLRPAVNGALLGAIALTEPSGGSDLAALTTEIQVNAETCLLRGKKAYISNGSVADFIIVLARDPQIGAQRAYTLVIVPRDVLGLTATRYPDKLGNRSCDHANLVFDEVVLPVTNILGQRGMGFELEMKQLTQERLILSIISYSQATQWLYRAVAHTRKRTAFGKYLIRHQAIAFRLAELRSELECVKALVQNTLTRYIRGEDCLVETAITKLRSAQFARRCVDECLQLRGGAGYMEDRALTRAYRDVRAASLAGGSDEMMLHIISKSLLR